MVSTVAGSGSTGSSDGAAFSSKFNVPVGIAVDSNGVLFVTKCYNNRVRKITSSGIVSTFAGAVRGFADGVGTDARFDCPHGITIDSTGNLLVADFVNHRIRKIDSAMTVTTLTGSAYGFLNSALSTARFSYPRGLTTDSAGNIYVADSYNHRIRKISADGYVSTFAGSGTPGYADGPSELASFNGPADISIDLKGVLYVIDAGNYVIRKIMPSGEVSTLSGVTVAGFSDGNATDARYSLLRGMAVDSMGNIYVADMNRIRKITVAETLPAITPPKSKIDLNQFMLDVIGGNVVSVKNDDFDNIVVGITSSAKTVHFKITESGEAFDLNRLSVNATTQIGSAILKFSSMKTVEWAVQLDGIGSAVLQDLSTDYTGNVYSVGVFTDSLSIFDQVSNKSLALIRMLNNIQNGFIIKFASNGTLLWFAHVQGNPISLSIKTTNDSVVAAIKFAKGPQVLFPCAITPIIGEKQVLNSVDNGIAVVRFASNGQIEWTRTVNFAPWEDEPLMSVNSNGDVSLSGWCSLLCSIYRNNETSILQTFGDVTCRHIGVNVILNRNGSVNTWYPLSKYLKVDSSRRFHCRFSLKETNMSIVSYGKRTDIKIDKTSLIDVVSSTKMVFLSIDGQQRYRSNISKNDEYLVMMQSKSMLWQSCSLFDYQLGQLNRRGDINDGTFAFDLTRQFGHWTSFSLAIFRKHDALIRFRPVGGVDFRCGFENGTHAYFFSFNSGQIEMSLIQIKSTDDSLWGLELERDQRTVAKSIRSFLFAFTMTNGSNTLYVNGQKLLGFHFCNADSFRLTTIDNSVSFDNIGIMKLPEPIDLWLTVPSEESVDSHNSDFTFTFGFERTKIIDNASETREPFSSPSRENPIDRLTLFGLSGLVFYFVVGGMAFVALLIIAGVTTVFLRKRRQRGRRDLTQYHITYTDNSKNVTAQSVMSNYAKSKNQTLVNTETNLGAMM